jgi:hypothetical protein
VLSGLDMRSLGYEPIRFPGPEFSQRRMRQIRVPPQIPTPAPIGVTASPLHIPTG